MVLATPAGPRAPEYTEPETVAGVGGWTPKEIPAEAGSTAEELGIEPKWFCT